MIDRCAPTTPLPAMAPCTFCGGSVDMEELAALRHLAFACPKAPAAVATWAIEQPGVVPPPIQGCTGLTRRRRR